MRPADVREGKPWDCAQCPVAIRLNKMFPGVTFYAGRNCIIAHKIAGDGDEEVRLIVGRYDTPPAVRQFMVLFDGVGAVHYVNPITFDLPLESLAERFPRAGVEKQ